MPSFHRKPNRLPAHCYKGQNVYSLTLCTQNRKPLFTNPDLVSTTLTTLKFTCSTHSFTVYAYCFMPDHLHLILLAQRKSASLPKTIQSFKSLAATQARQAGIIHLWQKGFYDHIIRSTDSLEAAAWYIFTNPLRAHLAAHAHDWPHSGSFLFEWKLLPPPSHPYQPSNTPPKSS